MTTYIPDNVPATSEELPEFLQRELERISDALRHRLDLDTARQSEVPRPQEGMLRYFDAGVYDPGEGTGPYIYTGGAWRRLLEVDDALTIFAFAAYGAMYRATPGAGADLGAAWQTVEFDTTRVAVPRGIAQDTGANTMAVTNDGVYALSVTLGWEHNSSNQGRTTQLRLFNVTTGTPNADPITIGTGRNAEATTYSITALFEITEAQKGDTFRLEIGNGDSYTSVVWNVSEWSIWNVGEWREPVA